MGQRATCLLMIVLAFLNFFFLMIRPPTRSTQSRSSAASDVYKRQPMNLEEPAVSENFPSYLCIHGHFYQPPRENPWLEAIEVQDSAGPDHDWNARITRECYAPNCRARLLDGQSKIANLLNNYAWIS